jgi:hypothetical protein
MAVKTMARVSLKKEAKVYFLHTKGIFLFLIVDLGISDGMDFPCEADILTEEDSFTLLKWKLDQNLLEKIHEAKSTSQKMCKSLVLARKPFLPFGKIGLVRINVNPDTFVQMAIQLAYIRLHKKPGMFILFFINHTYIFLPLFLYSSNVRNSNNKKISLWKNRNIKARFYRE